ncbi:uncharacterized protein Hqrw_2867 [Haloquadratum walsbyi C23]|jgi:hypothetical protein|uniref:Uncharacterized protein n=2 Tax=Haloquadratum walsbyi TaxID=293091 RepID=Q18H73_HALWD|nr:uncharacterized protein HQ_2558A [Haloquadratum walsbyi DSM 16790]CCC40678.1 uncharacterized protein Hqrw_2867 [Haloquadratum walsbyi C23]
MLRSIRVSKRLSPHRWGGQIFEVECECELCLETTICTESHDLIACSECQAELLPQKAV